MSKLLSQNRTTVNGTMPDYYPASSRRAPKGLAAGYFHACGGAWLYLHARLSGPDSQRRKCRGLKISKAWPAQSAGLLETTSRSPIPLRPKHAGKTIPMASL